MDEEALATVHGTAAFLYGGSRSGSELARFLTMKALSSVSPDRCLSDTLNFLTCQRTRSGSDTREFPASPCTLLSDDWTIDYMMHSCSADDCMYYSVWTTFRNSCA